MESLVLDLNNKQENPLAKICKPELRLILSNLPKLLPRILCFDDRRYDNVSSTCQSFGVVKLAMWEENAPLFTDKLVEINAPWPVSAEEYAV